MSKIKLTEAEIIASAEKAAEWVKSLEGQKVLREGRERCKRVAEKLRKERIVPWETLHRPFTI